MKERLIIKNFGPIKEVDLELGKMNILIGGQATGKSTIAKVLAVCRYFSFLVETKKYRIFNTSPFTDGLESFGLSDYLNSDSYFKYSCSLYEFEVKESIVDVTVDYDSLNDQLIEGRQHLFNVDFLRTSQKFESLLKGLLDFIPNSDNSELLNLSGIVIPNSFYLNNVAEVMDNPMNIPTERSLQSLFSLGKNPDISDGLYSWFATFHNKKNSSFSNEVVKIEPIEVEYKISHGIDFFKNKSHDFIGLNQGASGYKSVIPIVLLVKHYAKRKRKKTFIIEEPELNLFPKTQKKLMEFLVDSVNVHGNQFVLPTHSPYIITSLENMMYAFKMGNLNNGNYSEDVEKIIDKKYWIDPNEVNAYYLEGGNAKDIMQRDEALINKEYIDSVSEIINKDFDALLRIELKHENNQG